MIICGAPQYYIGDYLSGTQYHKNILKEIIGNQENDEGLRILNNKLSRIIKEYNIENIKFIIHYSKNEHTYKEHIIYLLKDLKEKNTNILEDVEEYLNHEEVGEYFKSLLLRIFKEK